MKKTILALLSCALVVSLSLMAADGDVVRKMKIKLKSGQTVDYVTDQIEKVSFVDGTPLADDMISVTDVGKELTKTFEVEVAVGVDEHSAQEYRRLKRLVITGYQFAEEDIPYYSPDYLKQYGYWANNPSLMYRDYGPKIFLEIGEGDKVPVPTARNTPLAGYSNEWNFIGMDYDNRKITAVAFPVTVSDDRNTLTIKEYDASTNMSFGVYRPAVMVKQTQIWNVAVTDIVMTRK